jgi:hypothetical protein
MNDPGAEIAPGLPTLWEVFFRPGLGGIWPEAGDSASAQTPDSNLVGDMC